MKHFLRLALALAVLVPASQVDASYGIYVGTNLTEDDSALLGGIEARHRLLLGYRAPHDSDTISKQDGPNVFCTPD